MRRTPEPRARGKKGAPNPPRGFPLPPCGPSHLAAKPAQSAKNVFRLTLRPLSHPTMPTSERITVRLGHQQLDALDDLAETEGVSRSLAVRRLVERAAGTAPKPASGPKGPAKPPARLDRDDLLDLLEEKARAGSAPAIRTLLDRLEAEAETEQLRRLTCE